MRKLLRFVTIWWRLAGPSIVKYVLITYKLNRLNMVLGVAIIYGGVWSTLQTKKQCKRVYKMSSFFSIRFTLHNASATTTDKLLAVYKTARRTWFLFNDFVLNFLFFEYNFYVGSILIIYHPLWQFELTWWLITYC